MLLFCMVGRLLLQILHAFMRVIIVLVAICRNSLLRVASKLRLPVVLALLLLLQLVLLVLLFVVWVVCEDISNCSGLS
jgi:hypothetical protein